jgi:integrase
MANIRERETGKWQVQVRHRGMRPIAKSFNTKTEAVRWARLMESEIDRGVFVDRTEAERCTIGELIDRYLSEVTPKKKSARQEKQRLTAPKGYFGVFTPAALRNTHIAAYRDARLAAGLAGATVVKELNSLSHLLDVAIKDWGIALHANPAKLMRRPQVARDRDRRLLPGEETKLFAACAKSRAPMLTAAVRFAIETGMRMGEILALQWRHVDMVQRVATLPDTKTGDARQVPLSTAAVGAISSLPRHLKDGRVFWTWKRADSLENAWRRAVKSAGIEDLRFHDLRHEAVSRLFELGLNPMEVASISGHRTLQMLKRYTHLKAAALAVKLG